MSKVVVVGGGAAGMMAGYISAINGHETVIIEKNNKLGKAYTSKNGTDVADSLEKDIVPFLNKLMEIASKF